MSLRPAITRLHRWLGLAAAILWLVQAVTGTLIVFHWEIDDASVRGPYQATDLRAIDLRLDQLRTWGGGHVVKSVWTSAGSEDRYNVNLETIAGGKPVVVRIDGSGQILRVRRDGELFTNGGFIQALVGIHHDLLGGNVGSWIVGTSGALLLTNLLAGLSLARPRRGGLRSVLLPRRGGAVVARRYGWHRAIGLWGALPAICLVIAGLLLVFQDGVASWLAPAPIEAANEPLHGEAIAFSVAVAAAFERYPDAQFSGASFPTATNAAYRIRLLQPGEPRRAYGTTNVFVSANDGRVMADFNALKASPSRQFLDRLFPFHTGEWGGTPGRFAVLATGAWLITMIVLGVLLWAARRIRAGDVRSTQ